MSEAVVTVDRPQDLEGDPVPGTECVKALLHETAESQAVVFRVAPGGRLPDHHHTTVWDLFVGLAGVGTIVYDGPGGSGRFTVNPGSFCAMPPGVRHEVRNASDSEEFAYLLIHAPWAGYDHIRTAD